MKSILHITLTLAAIAAIGRAETTPAVEADVVRQAVEKALPALQKSGTRVRAKKWLRLLPSSGAAGASDRHGRRPRL